jgi:hypothetical protein
MSGAPSWRLGDANTVAPPTPKRAAGESLVPGEVAVAYIGQDDELLGTVIRACLFPVENECIRMHTAGRNAVATFPVRGVVDHEEFEQRATWFTADPGEWERASLADRRAAVANLPVVPRLVLHCRLAPLPSGKASPDQPRRRRIDYGDGRSAIVTDGDAKRIEFSDGETVTVTELPEDGAGDVSQKPRPRYAVPGRFSLEIFDKDGMRVTRYGRHRPCDGLPEVL